MNWDTALSRPSPLRLGLFQKRFEGDDALLALSRARFERVGLGAEVYVESAREVQPILRLCPAHSPVALHLPRGWDLLDPTVAAQVVDIASSARAKAFALVVHDQPELATRPKDYQATLRSLDAVLADIPSSPALYVEYASGHELSQFVATWEALRELENVGCCVDVGHVGLRETRAAYQRMHPGQDPCALDPRDGRIERALGDVQAAVGAGRDSAFELLARIARMGKRLHVHLHDGHPLGVAGPYGLADHRSFLDPIPIGVSWRGRTALDPMFGPRGLARLVQESLAGGDPESVSLSLEIHPANGRSPLGDEAALFKHWSDHSAAERTSYWLDTLLQHALLLDAACEAALSGIRSTGRFVDE